MLAHIDGMHQEFMGSLCAVYFTPPLATTHRVAAFVAMWFIGVLVGYYGGLLIITVWLIQHSKLIIAIYFLVSLFGVTVIRQLIARLPETWDMLASAISRKIG